MDGFSFGDTPEMVDKLLELVLAGKKTATTSSWKEELANNNWKGKQWIVLDGKGVKRAVIETTELKKCRFDEVNETFVRDEGEGDLTLEYWRNEHEAFFRREGTYSPDMV